MAAPPQRTGEVKKKRRGTGERFIQAQGSARYVVRAKTKEEAIRKARELFLADIERGRKSFKKVKLSKRWSLMAGFEAERVKKGTTPKARKLDLRWRNSPRGRWLKGERG